MTSDRPLLDLDTPDPDLQAGPDRRSLQEIRVPLWVVALVTTGCVIVAVGLTWAWQASNDRRERQAEVNLVLSVPQSELLDGGGGPTGSSYFAQLQVFNAGPLPIRVDAVSSRSGGIRVNLIGGAQAAVTVQSRTAQRVSVGIGLLCRQWDQNQSIELAVEATTADGTRHRQVGSVSLQDIPWQEDLMSACADLPGVVGS